MAIDELGRRADIHDAAVVDDGDSIAQSFCLFHQMRGQEDGFAALPNVANQIPNRAPRLRVETGGQFIEEHHLRVVDQRQRDEEPLFLLARQRHEPRVTLVAQAQLFDQASAVDRRPVTAISRDETASHTVMRF